MCTDLSKGYNFIKDHKLRFLDFLRVQFFNIKITPKMTANGYSFATLFQIYQGWVTLLEKYISEKKRFKFRPFTEIRYEICYNTDFHTFDNLFCEKMTCQALPHEKEIYVNVIY